MSTEERDESQPRPRKVIPSIRRENTDQEGDRRPYNQGYNKPEGDYERRSYNRQDDRGGYNRSQGDYRSSYDNRQSYGDRQSRPRTYDNREGGGYDRPYNQQGNNRGYGNNYNREGGGGYGRNSYGNNRPSYGQGGGGSYNRPRQNNYDDRQGRAYSASPSGDGMGERKRRPRVGDARPNSYDNNRGNSYDNRGGGGYGNNNYRSQGGGGNRYPQQRQQRSGGYNQNRPPMQPPRQVKYKEVLADPNEPIRLNKFLSNAGVCSRREADEFIQAGVVRVNDEVVTELGTKITRQDKVLFHDQPVQIESKIYLVLNKPKNCVTTSEDPQERLTVMDLVKSACSERIYPVGRLDRNTTGVLLLTNDGDLASKLTHPSFKKKKVYHVWLDKEVSVEDMEKIANGLELEDGEIHADAISYASDIDKSQVGIEIHSGRNRIVRRIFESLGYHVLKLDRVYFAGLTKKNLPRGKWRYLNEREVNALRMGAFE
ncbi:RNA-binding S4 domain-containing protein [Parabacteroides sp. OttesenSCG-928-G07]|nr:RNA-binding S4 domain-containing protein [Parabacteroides sp. OttesenSCG-928-G21]MDL2278780.1 RNA-binding S4 domain-containing protein [Parabacteroides sp. OttesenSCG-928-G07]